MKLFRAQASVPEFSTSELERELYALEKIRDSGPPGEYMVDSFQRMGKDNYLRLIELRQIIKDRKFFTDNEVQARYIATDHIYMVTLTVPDEIAETHRVLPEEVGAEGERPAENAGNFAFTGREITMNKQDWQVDYRQI